MDDSQTPAAQVVHSLAEQQASGLPTPDDTRTVADWSGHVPAPPEPTVTEQRVGALEGAGFTMADLAEALQRVASLATYLTDSGTPEIAELVRNAAALRPLCSSCGSAAVVYRNFAEQPFCYPCALSETPVDTASTLIAASEADARHHPVGPTVTPVDAISILRAHADYLDPDGTSVPAVDALTAATLRMSAQFLEDVAPLPPLPRRRRLHPGLVGEMIETAHALQRAAAGPVDIRFVPVPRHDAELSTPIQDDACQVLEVDGQPARIHGQGDLSGGAAGAVSALVRIGRAQLAADPDGVGFRQLREGRWTPPEPDHDHG